MMPSTNRPEDFKFSPLTEEDRSRISRSLLNRVSGSFSSRLVSGPVTWRSTRELAALTLFELDLRVDSIEVTPEVATVLINGMRVSHIPTFLLRQGANAFVLDVLDDDTAGEPDRAALTRALKLAYASRGMRYDILRHAAVRAEPRQRNARLVLRSRRYDMGSQTALAVLATVSARGQHTVRSVMDAHPGIPNIREAVYALAANRRLTVDLWADQPEQMAVALAPQGSRS